MRSIVVVMALACCAVFSGEPLYQNDFEKAETGKKADDLGMLVIGDGEFKVVEQSDKKKALELNPFPLETYGVLFGPTETDDVTVELRAYSKAGKRKFPVFAAGLSGAGGYQLKVDPARKQLQIIKGEEIKASVPFTWVSETWTRLSLNVAKESDTKWIVQGKAWEHGKEEPKDWQVKFEETEKPLGGKAALWGLAFSGEAILFDDIVVKKSK